jgi:hypothetical protein
MIQHDLAAMPPVSPFVNVIDVYQRYCYLDSIVSLARRYAPITESLADNAKSHPSAESDKLLSILRENKGSPIDWDDILRAGNAWCDRYVDAGRKPSRGGKREAVDKVASEFSREHYRQPNAIDAILTSPVEPRKKICDAIRKAVLPAALGGVWGGFVAEDRAAANFSLTKTAVALTAYRADHGSFPPRLADLSPTYLTTIPKDVFIDSDLHYFRRDGGYLLYSVGMNCRDDGGTSMEDHAELRGGEPGDDIVVRVPPRQQPH